jgi:Rieske Fe-S protein
MASDKMRELSFAETDKAYLVTLTKVRHFRTQVPGQVTKEPVSAKPEQVTDGQEQRSSWEGSPIWLRRITPTPAPPSRLCSGDNYHMDMI